MINNFNNCNNKIQQDNNKLDYNNKINFINNHYNNNKLISKILWSNRFQ